MTDASDTQNTHNSDNDNKKALGDRDQTATRAAGFAKSAQDKDEERAEKERADKERADRQDSRAKDAPRDEEHLDEGLEDSMDGSDTPSSLQP